ncbi:MAG: hypothetical protein QOH41_957 [Blastocatellia bacterium]|jgi:hypothetical protein|nr:hypothetical protein [Blastocatellia bacterium]
MVMLCGRGNGSAILSSLPVLQDQGRLDIPRSADEESSGYVSR